MTEPVPSPDPSKVSSPEGTAESRPLCHIPLSRADAARSARNIAQWNAYLPSPCVRTMVRMGWDYTT